MATAKATLRGKDRRKGDVTGRGEAGVGEGVAPVAAVGLGAQLWLRP